MLVNNRDTQSRNFLNIWENPMFHRVFAYIRKVPLGDLPPSMNSILVLCFIRESIWGQFWTQLDRMDTQKKKVTLKNPISPRLCQNSSLVKIRNRDYSGMLSRQSRYNSRPAPSWRFEKSTVVIDHLNLAVFRWCPEHSQIHTGHVGPIWVFLILTNFLFWLLF